MLLARKRIFGIGEDAFVELVGANVERNAIIPTVVRSARVSFGNDDGQFGNERDLKLFKYLVRNRHTSPLEHVIFTFHISAPLFVAIHFWRHRTASVNAISARYVKMADRFYFPRKFRAQSKSNRQASVDAELQNSEAIATRWHDTLKQVYETYQWMLEQGVAREQARALLPEGRFTRWYWTMDLRNLLHFLSLRLDEGAQYETRLYAKAIAQILEWFDNSAWDAVNEVGFECL